MWLKVLVLCSALFHGTNAKCTVTDSKTKERADCVFPFTLSTDPEKVYTNCTNFLKGERFWCSTKVRYIWEEGNYFIFILFYFDLKILLSH